MKSSQSLFPPVSLPPNVWSLVLAGGEGERIRPFIEHWLGHRIPKQYCSFVGTRSMLQHTWDRASCLTTSSRMVTVCDTSHQPFVMKDFGKARDGHLVFQPKNRGTAAGVFLPLTYIRARNPNATVVVFPSDHFIYPEERFLQQVHSAVLAAEQWKERIILLASPPTSLELEYGWIEPGTSLGWIQGAELHSVHSFVEKPKLEQGVGIIARGGLWNTFVLTARIETLWNMGWRSCPSLMDRFEQLFDVIGTSLEGKVLEFIYHDMPRYNFAVDLLQQQREQIGVLKLRDVLWSDWGRSERIIETLSRIGRVPRFSTEKVKVTDDDSWHKKQSTIGLPQGCLSSAID